MTYKHVMLLLFIIIIIFVISVFTTGCKADGPYDSGTQDLCKPSFVSETPEHVKLYEVPKMCNRMRGFANIYIIVDRHGNAAVAADSNR